MSDQDAEELLRAYAVTFGSPAGQKVLADLDLFCHVIHPLDETDKVSDRRLFMNEGRREVALRIMKMAKVSLSEIYDLRLGRGMALRNTEGEVIHG